MKPALPTTWEICILAGGRSRRMGRDKARLRLGRRTLLGHIRAEAKKTNWPVRIIRRDAVPRCGPLGGVYTALRGTGAGAVLFLACDMPWIRGSLLRAVVRRLRRDDRAVFVRAGGVVGFPFALRREALAAVVEQLRRKKVSLRALARRLEARVFVPSRRQRAQLRNLNTPADWERARREWPRGQETPTSAKNL
jgi:molybdopterin-guanine dinucleotide biosynthesis protein A